MAASTATGTQAALVILRAIFAVTRPMPTMIAMPLSMMKSEIFDSDIPSLWATLIQSTHRRFVNPSMGGSPMFHTSPWPSAK